VRSTVSRGIVNLRRVGLTVASAIVLCLGVILVPFALLFLLLIPEIGATLGILSVALMALGSIGVVGGGRTP
jgi:hypothetical protein